MAKILQFSSESGVASDVEIANRDNRCACERDFRKIFLRTTRQNVISAQALFDGIFLQNESDSTLISVIIQHFHGQSMGVKLMQLLYEIA